MSCWWFPKKGSLMRETGHNSKEHVNNTIPVWIQAASSYIRSEKLTAEYGYSDRRDRLSRESRDEQSRLPNSASWFSNAHEIKQARCSKPNIDLSSGAYGRLDSTRLECNELSAQCRWRPNQHRVFRICTDLNQCILSIWCTMGFQLTRPILALNGRRNLASQGQNEGMDCS
jgi:hypothetical protein